MNPVEIQQELETAAKQLDAASTRLANAIKEFEGRVDVETGEWHPGPKLVVEKLVEQECERIYSEYEEAEKRPPPESIREARSRSAIRREHADLWADYERLSSEVASIQKWIASKKDAISARQSVLSAEKKLMEVS